MDKLIKKIIGLTLFLPIYFFFSTKLAYGKVKPVAGGNQGGTISNPLEKLGSLQDVFLALLNVIIQIGTVVTVVFIVVAGLKMIMARGNPEELQKAKNMLWFTLIGGTIVLGAQAILTVVVNVIDGLQ
jgi:hypothetical protein